MVTLPILLTEEELTTIEDLAAVNYPPEKIALYLSIDKKAFLQVWYDKESLIRTHYDKGKLQSDFLISQKQLELAKSGNITASQTFIALRKDNEIETIRNQILFGTDVD